MFDVMGVWECGASGASGPHLLAVSAVRPPESTVHHHLMANVSGRWESLAEFVDEESAWQAVRTLSELAETHMCVRVGGVGVLSGVGGDHPGVEWVSFGPGTSEWEAGAGERLSDRGVSGDPMGFAEPGEPGRSGEPGESGDDADQGEGLPPASARIWLLPADDGSGVALLLPRLRGAEPIAFFESIEGADLVSRRLDALTGTGPKEH